MINIVLDEELFEFVQEGIKTVICQKGLLPYIIGSARLQLKNSNTFLHIEVIDRKGYMFEDITDDISYANGYNNKSDFKRALEEEYGWIDNFTSITVINFALLPAIDDSGIVYDE